MPWNKIDNLLKKTEAFYKKALWEELLSDSQIKTAETHEEKRIRLDKENAARRKALSDQAKLFLEQNEPKVKKEPRESILKLTPEEEAEQAQREQEEEAPLSGEPDEDLGLYNDIKLLSKDVSNMVVSDELSLIAELYKNVLRNGNGFNYLKNTIERADNAISDEYSEYEDEEDKDEDDVRTPGQEQKRQSEAVSNLINRIYADIKNRAAQSGKNIKVRDDDATIEQFNNIRHAINAENEHRSKTKEGLTAAQLADLESGGLEHGDDDKGTLDRGEIAGKRAPEGGGTPGMGVVDMYAPKEWAKSYKGEIDRYTDQLSSATSPADKKNLADLIETLKQLHAVTVEKEAMQSDPAVAWTVKPRILSPDKKTVISPRTKTIDDPAQRAKFEDINKRQQALKQKKTAITSKLRTHKAAEENASLHTKLTTAGPKEKLLLQQKIALNELIKSPDKRKSQELRLRKQLVNSLGGNIDPTDSMYRNMSGPEEYLPSVPQEHINHMMAKIAEAAKFKKSMSDIHIEQAENIKKEFEYSGKVRGAPLSVEGIFIQFKQSIPSIKMGIKKKITAEFRESKNTAYLPYRDAISSALQSGNADAVKLAEKAFQKQLNDDAEQHPAIKSFITYSESFVKYLVELKALHKKESATEENGTVLLSATSPEIIQNFITEGKRLFALEMARNPGDTRRGISNVAKAIAIIIEQLEERVQGKQAEGFNQMNIKQKLAALRSHFAQEELKKMAEGDTNFYAGPTEELTQPLPQQLTNMMPTQQMSKAEADAAADRIMDNIIDNLKIKGLDY